MGPALTPPGGPQRVAGRVENEGISLQGAKASRDRDREVRSGKGRSGGTGSSPAC